MVVISKNILIVEDTKPLAKALEIKLQAAGFVTKLATDGRQALKILKKQIFHLIILDIVMPQKNGLEVLRELQLKGNSIPILVLSNVSRHESLKEVLTLGAKNFLVKVNTPLSDVVSCVQSLTQD